MYKQIIKVERVMGLGSKDQAIGFAILIVCIVMAVSYSVTLFYPQWLVSVGLLIAADSVQFWLIAVPVLIAFAIAIYMGVWFGCMKATSMPPKLIERLMSPVRKIRKALKRA